MNDQESFRALQLMNELEDGEAISQRELASRLGVAVGLVNSYLKNFVAKGYVRVKSFPRNRYAYLLTPKGFAEKSQLAYQHLAYFTGLYTTTRQNYLNLFEQLKNKNINEVVFVGIDEVAEIAYLSLQETGLVLKGVFDVSPGEQSFFGLEVRPLQDVLETSQVLIVTSLKRGSSLHDTLVEVGADQCSIHMVD